jgi:hypothetical protein
VAFFLKAPPLTREVRAWRIRLALYPHRLLRSQLERRGR